jgi:very-short-patch-repair endonuclease
MNKVSRMELLTRRLLRVYFKDWEVLYNHRPDWFKNEKTGKNLELDIYYPELLLAVEVNGIQHKLRENQRRDQLKYKVCRSRGITLIQVSKYTRILQIKEKLENYFSSARAQILFSGLPIDL